MRFIAILAFGGSLVCVSPAAPCSIVGSARPTAIVLIQRADVIVVAVAREVHPRSPGLVQFEVSETLKGNAVTPFLWIRGRFIDRDDFNDLTVPVNGVRPDGYGGSCYASDYRRDARYLLLLQRTATEVTILGAIVARERSDPAERRPVARLGPPAGG